MKIYDDDLIKRMISDNSNGIDISYFYRTRVWKNLSHKILNDQKECQICKSKGRYRQADMTHHVNHIKDRPDLALSEYYTDIDGKEQRNLIAVCYPCHKFECHPEQLQWIVKPKAKPLTAERWD